jgi:hypothetical protein
VAAAELAPYLKQWLRAEALPQWDVTIVPS